MPAGIDPADCRASIDENSQQLAAADASARLALAEVCAGSPDLAAALRAGDAEGLRQAVAARDRQGLESLQAQVYAWFRQSPAEQRLPCKALLNLVASTTFLRYPPAD